MTALQAPGKPRMPQRVALPRRRPRLLLPWLQWLVVWSVVLVAAVFLGGSWYFAGRIESGALASTPGQALPAYDDVLVVSARRGQVTLRKATDAGPSFDAAATYGLAWDGGTGIVGPASRNADGTVTRALKILQGAAPAVRQRAALDRAVWVDEPPQGFRIAKLDVSVGGLPAWYFPSGPGSFSTMAIFVHGQNGTRNDGLRFVTAAVPAGVPVLDVTYRGDLRAPEDPSGRVQYGQTEWRDLEAAVDWALDQGATHVVLVGQSMGGAVVAAFLENSDRRRVVSGIILDSPALSLESLIQYGARDAMPGGGPVPASVLWSAQQIASMRYGIDWAAVDYLDNTDWLQIKTLVIHGSADPVVPLATSQQLQRSQPVLVGLEVFPGALHAESWNADSARYTMAVRNYLEMARP